MHSRSCLVRVLSGKGDMGETEPVGNDRGTVLRPAVLEDLQSRAVRTVAGQAQVDTLEPRSGNTGDDVYRWADAPPPTPTCGSRWRPTLRRPATLPRRCLRRTPGRTCAACTSASWCLTGVDIGGAENDPRQKLRVLEPYSEHP